MSSAYVLMRVACTDDVTYLPCCFAMSLQSVKGNDLNEIAIDLLSSLSYKPTDFSHLTRETHSLMPKNHELWYSRTPSLLAEFIIPELVHEMNEKTAYKSCQASFHIIISHRLFSVKIWFNK